MSASRVALVTGAASGIGLSLTKHLIGRGYNVGMCDVNSEAGNTLSAELGEQVVFIKCDVAIYEDQAEAFQQVWNRWGRLDFVAANAGIGSSCDIFDTTSTGDVPPPKPNLKIMDINLIGVVYTVFIAQHYMKRNSSPGGKITITASAAALYPMEFAPLYASSKSGIPALVRSMAPRLNESNIAINCLCPGVFDSGLTGPLVSVLKKDQLTSHASLLGAYDRFLDGEETGCAAEISGDNIYLRKHHDYADELQEYVCLNFPQLVRKARSNASSKS